MKKWDFSEDSLAKIFGVEAGEMEEKSRLREFFLEKSEFSAIRSNAKMKICVGFKGSGKSSLFEYSMLLDDESGNPNVKIRPDDITEIYENFGETSEFLRLISIWKQGICKLIAAKLIDSCDITVGEDEESIMKWAYKQGYKKKDFISSLSEKLSPIWNKYVKDNDRDDVSKALMIRFIQGKQISIYLDDLDRGWKGEKIDLDRLGALISAVSDLTQLLDGVKFRIALRSDVYDAIRINREIADKYEMDVVKCDWNNYEIFVSLHRRISTYFSLDVDRDRIERLKQIDLSREIDFIINPTYTIGLEANQKTKPTYKLLMTNIRRRPRDLVKLLRMAAKRARDENSIRISGQNIIDCLGDYSQNRLDDMIIEFQGYEPNMRDLVMGMAPTRAELANRQESSWHVYRTDELIAKIARIKNNVRTKRTAKEVAELFYKIGFITARKVHENQIKRLYWEDNKRLFSGASGDQGYLWEIHPAYRGPLNSAMHKRWWEEPDFDVAG